VGNDGLFDSSAAEEVADDVGEAGVPGALALQLALDAIEGMDPAMGDFLADAVEFQFADDDVGAAIEAVINEGVGEERADGVEHVSTVFRISYQEQILALLHVMWAAD
jgi:hypothetical protein